MYLKKILELYRVLNFLQDVTTLMESFDKPSQKISTYIHMGDWVFNVRIIIYELSLHIITNGFVYGYRRDK